jgi:hypothetical protein
LAGDQNITQEGLGSREALVGRLPIPLRCFGMVPRHGLTTLVHHGEGGLCRRCALVGGEAVPLERFRIVRSYQKDVPFLMVGDPKKAFYKDFGVETSLGFMSLKALGAAMRGMAHGHFGLRLAGGPTTRMLLPAT